MSLLTDTEKAKIKRTKPAVQLAAQKMLNRSAEAAKMSRPTGTQPSSRPTDNTRPRKSQTQTRASPPTYGTPISSIRPSQRTNLYEEEDTDSDEEESILHALPAANALQYSDLPTSMDGMARRRESAVVSPPLEDDIPDGLDKVGKMKHALGKNANIPAYAGRVGKRRPEDDLDNHEIKRLRETKHSWSAIVQKLNEKRIEDGLEPSWTDAAVYGRFVRNGPKIAFMLGQHDWDAKDYMHMKDEKKATKETPQRPTHLSDSIREHLYEAVVDTRASFWDNVADLLEIKTGHKYTSEQCATMWDLV